MEKRELVEAQLVELDLIEMSETNGGGKIAYWFGYACGLAYRGLRAAGEYGTNENMY